MCFGWVFEAGDAFDNIDIALLISWRFVGVGKWF